MQSVSTVSDLHLFCKRSQAERYMPGILDAASRADHFVLNGDIFDFRWTTLSTIDETVNEAIRWLTDFLSANPQCQVHYVLGNHDYVLAFTDALSVLTEKTDNLSCHPFHLRLGEVLFLHGDAGGGDGSVAGLKRYREKWLHDKKKGAILNMAHDLAFGMGLHRAVYRMGFPTEKLVHKLTHYINEIGEGTETGTKRVYFGHTHIPISDYAFKGLRFFNCGAPLRGIQFEILRTEFEPGVDTNGTRS
jgi:UDP-2,3-diacylglucosamine hydrolase